MLHPHREQRPTARRALPKNLFYPGAARANWVFRLLDGEKIGAGSVQKMATRPYTAPVAFVRATKPKFRGPLDFADDILYY